MIVVSLVINNNEHNNYICMYTYIYIYIYIYMHT